MQVFFGSGRSRRVCGPTHLGGIGEGEFADPGLEHKCGDVEGGTLLDVEFGGVADGLHEGERATGWNRVDDADVFIHTIYFWGRLPRDGEGFRGKVWYQNVPRF